MTPKLITTLKTYSFPSFTRDVGAGITVAMVAIPLSIAIAIASGATPQAGLITAVIGGFLISLLGGSRVQIGGPTGAFIVVVFGIIMAHGMDGLITATLMAGVILLIAGYFRAGSLVSYVPQPVVDGFTIGIALIIASSQFSDLFGLTPGSVPTDFIPKLVALAAHLNQIDPISVIIGLSTGILIIGFRRIAPKWPGLIVAVTLTSGAVYLFDLPVDTIAGRFGALPNSLPAPRLPDLSLARLIELLPSALIIAFLAGVESLLSALVADRMIDGRHRLHAEVLAQGAANIGSALFGGLPATGAIARTATNVQAGGRTPVAGLVHAVVVLLALIFATPLVGHMALPALAALLIITAWNMSEPHKWRLHLKAIPSDRFLIFLTFFLTVVADLTIAIGTGVVIGLALRLRRHSDADDWTTPRR